MTSFRDLNGLRSPALFRRLPPREELLSTQTAPDYAGEMAILDHAPRSATLIATTDLRLLTLSGERKLEQELEEANAYRRERFFGKFTRAFTLPDNVDAERIGAAFKDGVLEVRVPKADRVKPRKIEVSAA